MNYRKLVKTAVSIQRKYSSLSLDEETYEEIGPAKVKDYIGEVVNEEELQEMPTARDIEKFYWERDYGMKPSNFPGYNPTRSDHAYKLNLFHEGKDMDVSPLTPEELARIEGDEIESDSRYLKGPRSHEQFSGSTAPKDRTMQHEDDLDIKDRMKKSKGDDRLLPNWDEDDWELTPEEWAEIEG